MLYWILPNLYMVQCIYLEFETIEMYSSFLYLSLVLSLPQVFVS